MTQQGLFDPPVRGHRPTRRPSDAVKNRKAGLEKASSGAGFQRDILLRAYLRCGALTDAEACNVVGWYRSTVNARRNELMKLGKVEEKGSKKNPTTGIANTLYGLK